MDGEDDPLYKPVVKVFAPVILRAETCLEEIFILEALLLGSIGKGMPVRRGPAQSVFLYGRIFQAAGVEIVKTHCLAFAGFKLFPEEVPCIFGDQDQALVPLSGSDVLCTFFLFDNFDVVLLGEVPQGVRVGHVFMLHDEAYGRATLVAAEAVVNTFGWNDVERRSFFIVERTASPPFGPSLPERHEVAYHLFDLGGIEDLLYGFLGDHGLFVEVVRIVNPFIFNLTGIRNA